MSDLISKQAILDRTVNRNSIWNKITDSEGNNLEDILNSIPSAESKGDLISRQAVENITWEEPSYSDPLNVLTEVREKVRALPSVENKGEWIPVSERLPEELKGVLVYCPTNDNIFCAYLEKGVWKIFSPIASEEIKEIVTAWQPLPEPYKAERGE